MLKIKKNSTPFQTFIINKLLLKLKMTCKIINLKTRLQAIRNNNLRNRSQKQKFTIYYLKMINFALFNLNLIKRIEVKLWNKSP